MNTPSIRLVYRSRGGFGFVWRGRCSCGCGGYLYLAARGGKLVSFLGYREARDYAEGLA